MRPLTSFFLTAGQTVGLAVISDVGYSKRRVYLSHAIYYRCTSGISERGLSAFGSSCKLASCV